MFITDETTTSTKEVSQLIPNLTYSETATLLAMASEALRLGQTLGDTIEERNADIKGITDGGCCLLPNLKDVSEDLSLISLVTFCAAQLTQTYRWF
jgi:hypothetical protein